MAATYGVDAHELSALQGLALARSACHLPEVEERKKERPTPVARRALRGPLQARATEVTCRKWKLTESITTSRTCEAVNE